MDVFAAGVLEAEAVEEADDGFGVKAGIQDNLEELVNLAMFQGMFEQTGADVGVLPILVDAKATDFADVSILFMEAADHAQDLPVVFGNPEMIGIFTEIGFVNIVDICPGIVGSNLAGE